jgi:hypothetical protein
MTFGQNLRATLALFLAGALACPPAQALVTFNDSHDHIYVTGSFGVGRDSNIFANHDSQGDFVYTSSILAEYSRRAGWIGLNASVAVNASRYGKIKGENFDNPTYSIELTKKTGRTTGSLTLNAARESHADSAANLRSMSWNYAVGLNFAYPIINRLKLSGGLGYSARKYVEQTALANLSTYTANADLFYILTGERDLISGYRYRYSQTSRNTVTTDHALTAGLNGLLLAGIEGVIRAGYQVRIPKGVGTQEPTFKGLTMSGSTSYALTRKATISGQISRDFSTTATDASVDSTSAGISAKYVRNVHWSASLDAGWGDSRFLGEAGRIVVSAGPPPVLGRNRHDNFANWDANLTYAHSERLSMSFGYSWFENWSTIAYADFIRTNWNLNLSSRW